MILPLPHSLFCTQFMHLAKIKVLHCSHQTGIVLHVQLVKFQELQGNRTTKEKKKEYASKYFHHFALLNVALWRFDQCRQPLLGEVT